MFELNMTDGLRGYGSCNVICKWLCHSSQGPKIVRPSSETRWDVKKWALFTKVGYGVPVFPRPIYYCQQRWWNWHWCLEKMYAVWGYCSRNSRNCKRTNVHPFFIPLDSSSPFSFESTSSVGWGPSEDFVAAIVVVNVLRPTALLIPESTTKVRLRYNYF